MAYSRFIYSALLSSDVASQNQAGSEPGPSLEARLSSPRRFPASPPPVRDARYRWASGGRETPQARREMMDGRAGSVGLAALFTGRVSGFPGCCTETLLDGVVGSGSCIYQPD